ncbi:hypothetical protein OJAV_G00079020 [Oryzias javanicus]|uniref:Uncharacterized protein n=1 Tax=Oryzias javanicus TaxID=123683 RepID=A0A3S2MYN5_ORYJA|nr:hypothetical protein OJAV_G00079020 [Oryzias javanicus]
MSSDQEQTESDSSDSFKSLEDNQEKRTDDEGDSSDNFEDAKEEVADFLQARSPPGDLSSSLAANNAGPSEDTKLIQKSPDEAEESTEMECQEATNKPKEGEISEGKDNQTLETKPADSPDKRSDEEEEEECEEDNMDSTFKGKAPPPTM